MIKLNVILGNGFKSESTEKLALVLACSNILTKQISEGSKTVKYKGVIGV
jgi:hypothetical protein